ncbi:MAG: hypothetical protein ABIP46_04250 [Polaromonas sp.]
MTTTKTNSGVHKLTRGLALVLATTLACSASFAEKPEWAGGGKNGKGNKHEQMEKSDQGSPANGNGNGNGNGKQRGERAEVKVGGYFGEQQRVTIQNYYGNQFKSGHCPPGLAKKNNGCMPPGQAKKYAVGQPLPRDVVYYPVPSAVVVQLGTPPSGYKYVRVASDILLIALGTSMVVDAIQDLNRL